ILIDKHDGRAFPFFGILRHTSEMIVVGSEVVERCFVDHAGHKRIKAARSQYNVWLAIAGQAQWRNPKDVNKGSRAVSTSRATTTDWSRPCISTTRSTRRQFDGCDPDCDRQRCRAGACPRARRPAAGFV